VFDRLNRAAKVPMLHGRRDMPDANLKTVLIFSSVMAVLASAVTAGEGTWLPAEQPARSGPNFDQGMPARDGPSSQTWFVSGEGFVRP
jgi:hypothetical protein